MRPAAALLLLIGICETSFAQTADRNRVALVIGIQNYVSVPPLRNSLNDAHDMSEVLKARQFEVIELYDPKTKRDLQDAVRKYFGLLQSKTSAVGMVYYSGHGMQVDGSNYLIPTDADPQIKADLDDQCLNIDYVMQAIEQAGNSLNICVLDACRNNPFRSFSRSAEKGLSMVNTPKGSYVVYSTKPGSVASDGVGRNGLFTSKLLKYIGAQGLNIEQVFKKVAADVAAESGDAQRPWIASDYTGDFFFTSSGDNPIAEPKPSIPDHASVPVQSRKGGYVNTKSNDAANKLTMVTTDGKLWGYANPRGELIVRAQFEKCSPFSEGFAAVHDTKNKSYYFINTKGERLATYVSNFSLFSSFGTDGEGFYSGMVRVQIDSKWGFMNRLGKLAIAAKYDEVTRFSEGFATAKSGSTYVVVDVDGHEIPVQAAGVVDMNHFSENLALFKTSDKKVGFVDTQGKVIISPKFESAGYFVNKLAWAKGDEGLYGYINPKGEWQIKPTFEVCKDFDAESGLARIKVNDKWAYVSGTGETISVNDTESWGDFSEGLAQGKKGGLRGFYDNKAQWVIAPQFEAVRDFKNGYAAAKLGGKWGVIDKTGTWVVNASFDRVRDMELVN